MARFCDKCGTQINEGAKFCPGCGAVVENVPPLPVQQTYAPPPQQTYAPPPQQYYGPPQAQKKKFPLWLIIVIAAAAAVCILAIVGNTAAEKNADEGYTEETIVVTADTNTEVTEEEPAAEDEPVVPERGTFTVYPVIVGEGTDFPLNAKISIPDDATGKVPAVVLVHGDGDFDMDEEVLGNRPFRDIAEYLSSYGIAVIRYDKRNFKYWAKMKETFGGGMTAYDAVMEDAILATELIKSDPRIDENRVYILGHSFGAFVAPRIHTEGGDFAGMISFSGSCSSFIDFQANKYLYDASFMPEGQEKEDEIQRWEKFRRDMKSYFNTASDDELKSQQWGQFTMYYYADVEKHPSAGYIKNMTIPILVLQGSEDFAVVADVEFPAWQELLAGRTNATFKLYEGLNHFLFPSAGYGEEDWEKEYGAPGHTDEQVLKDIVEWVHLN